MCSLDVVVVPFLDRLVGIPLAAIQVVAASMSVSGVGLLSLEGGSISLSAADVCSFVQPLAYGIACWRTEHVLRKYPEEANRITAAQLLACFGMSLLSTMVGYAVNDVGAPTMEQFSEWFSSVHVLVALVWAGIFTTAFT